MVRRLVVAGLAVVCAVSSFSGAHAAESYTIRAGWAPNWRGAGQSYGGYDARGSLTEYSFSSTGCDPSSLSSELQGVDAYVLDARPYAGTTITTQWTAAAGLAGRSYVNFYGQYCNGFTAFRTEPWTTSTTSAVTVPAQAHWMVFTAELKKDISFTIGG